MTAEHKQMNDRYIYRGEPEQRVFGALPPGDYNYVITEAGEPYQKDNGNWVLAVKLAIQPSGQTVFANPWSGKTSSGEERDGIGELLISCARAPKPGTEPLWSKLIGARGRVRLKVEIAQMGQLAGKEVSKVAFFMVPKQVGPTTEPTRQSYSPQEVAQASKTAQAAAGGGDIEPDDIPF
jgi:hypothetical protein